MTHTFLEVRAYENIRTRHKRSHLYAEMMAKMALRRYKLLLLAAGRADALLCLRYGQFDYVLLLVSCRSIWTISYTIGWLFWA